LEEQMQCKEKQTVTRRETDSITADST